MKAFNYIILFFIVASCQKPYDTKLGQENSNQDVWLVPENKVLYQDSEKDRIQSIDDPHFISVNESNLKPDEMVLVTKHNEVTKIYPVSVLAVHEIVNDNIGNNYYSLTYCPLTESGIIWNREINGEIMTFGVSGMLYNENLMPYDRATESIWSQMGTKCVNGKLIGLVPETYSLLETKFSTIQYSYPDALVLSHANCDSISCGRSGNLKKEPLDDETFILPSDQDFFGFIRNDNLLLFNLALFTEETQVITAHFQGASLIVCGNQELHFYTAFLKNQNNNHFIFEAVQNEFPIVMTDNTGNKYDVFGYVIEGPDKGFHLEKANAYLARTFAWELFFKNIKLYE